MKWQRSLFSLLVLGSTALAGEPVPVLPGSANPVPVTGEFSGACLDGSGPAVLTCNEMDGKQGGRLSGNRNFPNFIGWLSNPLQNIDPRAVTELWPVFGNSWISSLPALPNGSIQLYGAGLNVALSERLSLGLNQGGYAAADFNGNQTALFLDHAGVLRSPQESGGDREGWLNLGGWVQYTLIENIAAQCLLTAGLRWEAPAGSSDIFQGHGPPYLAPYATIGKEFGHFHVLATAGYQFPAGSGDLTSDFFYTNVHLDRQMFGWLYPLVEVNATYHTTSVALDLPTQHGFIDLNNFEASGDIVSLAVGANAVLVPSKLEVGAVYSTTISTQHNFDMNGLLVKMVLRY
jgi:hypothetical protein